jgi:hypothetical protein
MDYDRLVTLLLDLFRIAFMAKMALRYAGFPVEEQFPLSRLPLGVLAPSASQGASLEKYHCADSRSIMG